MLNNCEGNNFAAEDNNPAVKFVVAGEAMRIWPAGGSEANHIQRHVLLADS